MIILLITILICSNSMSSTFEGNLTELYLKATTNPFNKFSLDKFHFFVENHKNELIESNEGREFIKESLRLKKINLFKNELDKCIGTDILEIDSARKLINASLNQELNISTCIAKIPNVLDIESSDFIENFDKSNKQTRLSNLNKEIFKDTFVKATQAEARLQYLVRDNSKSNGEWNLSIPNTICRLNSNCPKSLSDLALEAGKNQIMQLEQAGVKRETSKESSLRLSNNIIEMYSSFYSSNHPYFYSNEEISNVNNQLKKNLDIKNSDEVMFRSNPQTVRHLVTYRYSDEDDIIRRNSTKSQTGKLIQRAHLQSIESDLLGSTPKKFQRIKSDILNDPLSRQLSSNFEMSDSLGFNIQPQILNIPGIGKSVILINENTSLDKPLINKLSQLTSESILKEKNTQIKVMKKNLNELSNEIFSSNSDTQGLEETLKKLIISNPSAAIRELLKNPSSIDLYCDAIKEIENDEQKDKYISYGLMAASIAVLPIAIAASPIVSGVALATVGISDIAYSTQQFVYLKEISNLKELSCYGSGGTDNVCKEYQSDMNEAIMILSAVGIGYGVSGGMKLVKYLPKISSLPDHVRSNPKLIEILRNKKSVILNSDEIPEDFMDELLAELDSMKPEFSSVLKKVENTNLIDPSSREFRNLTSEQVSSIFKGRLVDDKVISKLQIQIRSRQRSNLAAAKFAKENGWEPSNSDSLIIMAEDLNRKPGMFSVDLKVRPEELKNNQVFGHKPGWVQVQVHGNGSNFTNNYNAYSAKELAENLRDKGHTNQPIELASCWGGKPNGDGLSMAQQLSNEMGVPVVAPTKPLEMSGVPMIIDSTTKKANGRWRVFYPNSI